MATLVYWTNRMASLSRFIKDSDPSYVHFYVNVSMEHNSQLSLVNAYRDQLFQFLHGCNGTRNALKDAHGL